MKNLVEIPMEVARRRVSLTIALILWSVEPAAAKATETYTITHGVAYSERDGETLLADVYQPVGEGPFPGVLCVHGGAWTLGSRGEMVQAARTLAAGGYTAVSISYRLAPKYKFPAQIEDCREAVGWMRSHAADHKIDPARIGALGYSAGGHLVALLGVGGAPDVATGGNPSDEEGVDPRLQAVVAGGAPCDFRQTPPNRRGLVFWLGGTRGEKPEVYEAASSAKFVTPDDPPFLFFHGGKDRLVNIDEPTAMMSLLEQAGVPVEMYVLPGAGHVRTFFSQAAYDRAVEFFDDHLKQP